MYLDYRHIGIMCTYLDWWQKQCTFDPQILLGLVKLISLCYLIEDQRPIMSQTIFC